MGSRAFVEIDFAGLSSEVTSLSIQGRAGSAETGASTFPVALPNARLGALQSSAQLTPDQLVAVLSGQTYLTVHTAINSGGEIRGQILP